MFTDKYGLDMDDYRFSAPNVIGIRPRDWDLIKSKTNLFSFGGHIVPSNWNKIVQIIDSNTIRTILKISTGRKKNKSTFSMEFTDISLYNVATALLDITARFNNFIIEKSMADFFTLELPHSSNSSSSSSISSNSSSSSNSNSNSSSSKSSSSNSSSNSNSSNSDDKAVFDPDKLNSQWS